MALAALGLVVILGTAQGLPIPRSAGDWLALAAGICFAYASVRSNASGPTDVFSGAFAVTSGSLIASIALLVLAPSNVIGPWPGWPVVQATLPASAAIALLWFMPTNFVLLWATQRLPPARVGLLLMTEVVAGVVSAAALAGEPFGWQQGLGALLIIAAGVVDVLGRQPDSPQPIAQSNIRT
jgi:drug/metabolite transporter (DMT)-like permease